MQITIEPVHLLQAHHDKSLLEWINTVPIVPGSFNNVASAFPTLSGRALRGLLLNAANVEPMLATATYETIAKQYTPNRLWDAYHALVLEDESALSELRRDPAPQFVWFRNRRAPLDAVLAVAYLFVAIRETWVLTDEQKQAVPFVLGRVVDSLSRGFHKLTHLESTINPLRAVYTRSHMDGTSPDETVAIVDAKVYAAYLAAGYTDVQLVDIIEETNADVRVVRQV